MLLAVLEEAAAVVEEVTGVVALVAEGLETVAEGVAEEEGTVELTELLGVEEEEGVLVDCTELGAGEDTSSCICTRLFSASSVLNIWVSY